MVKFKYVDFSRNTAKKNPDMILREYYRIRKEKSDVLQEELNSKQEVKVNFNYFILESAIKLISNNIKTQADITLTGSFDYEELEQIFIRLESRKKRIENLRYSLREINQEIVKFCTKYTNKW